MHGSLTNATICKTGSNKDLHDTQLIHVYMLTKINGETRNKRERIGKEKMKRKNKYFAEGLLFISPGSWWERGGGRWEYQYTEWRRESKTVGTREYSVNTQRQSHLVRSIAHETEEMRKPLDHGTCSKALCDKEKETNSGFWDKPDWSHWVDTEVGKGSSTWTKAVFLFKHK